jgi:hypothetical protein
MKTTDPRDSLDRTIDDLLAKRPLQPSDDFAARVLAAADALPAAKQARPSPMGKLLRFALPVAAVIAVTLTLTQFTQEAPITEIASHRVQPAPAKATESLSEIDMQEIFLLEETLASLSSLLDDSLSSADLLSTFDTYYFEI